MPNIVAHYICGNLVAKKLNITSPEYIKGNIYPDYVDKNKHYRIKGKLFEVPDLERFIKEENTSNRLFKLGFLSHLMLDKLFLDGFVPENIYSKIDKRINIFEPDKIYTDYTNISNRLLRHYNLSINDLDLLISDKTNIDFTKYKNNIEVINKCNSEDLKYLDIDEFISFLDDSSEKISQYIKKKDIEYIKQI